MFMANVLHLLPQNVDPGVSHTLADISHLGIFLGVGGFAYEAAGTVFTSKPCITSPIQHEGAS